MPRAVAMLLDRGRGGRARAAVLVALLAGAAFWVVDAFIDAAISRHTFLEELLLPSGREIWTRVLVTALLVLVSLQQRASQRLHLFSAALDAAPDGIQLAGLDGRIAYSNRAVKEIYGFSPAELQGKSVDEMNVDPELASRVILPAIARDGRWEGEIEVKHKDGGSFPIWLTTSLIHGGRGAPLAAVGVIRDISERKRAEEALRTYARDLEEATRLKDLFGDILRHDLLAPATSLQLSIGRLMRHPVDEPTAKLLATANRSCARLTGMIEDAATYAKLSATREIQFSELELGAVLRTVVADFELVRQEHGAGIQLDAPGTYPVRAHPMLADVFANLVSNAIKYGRAGGTIGIAIRDVGDGWRVSVSDTGEGIPDADKERVFTRFERLGKEGVKGTGIGLAIAKRIVELHGGRIWVEDNAAGGSVFIVDVAKGSVATAELGAAGERSGSA